MGHFVAMYWRGQIALPLQNHVNATFAGVIVPNYAIVRRLLYQTYSFNMFDEKTTSLSGPIWPNWQASIAQWPYPLIQAAK